MLVDTSRVSFDASPSSPPPARIQVDVDGRWFRDTNGRLVLIDRTRVMRRLLAALVRRHLEAPSETMTTTELYDSAWGRPAASQAVAQARVYMTLCRLRSFGLSGVIVHERAGYRIAADVHVDCKAA